MEEQSLISKMERERILERSGEHEIEKDREYGSNSNCCRVHLFPFIFIAAVLFIKAHGGCQVNGPKVAKFLDR
jgi:hypothetical protein